ncbi:hypothetical protein G8S55_06785 [Clostridium botulinum C]|uniref:hypothetical protein n=1 Tax=Clostridium botulinum TaxID=1491 RepID=UPI001E2D15A1|nr:hypothetical protein [Clostridium botulinum]MCD3216958.1 hypothetical protein [Clostridium botulinum C]
MIDKLIIDCSTGKIRKENYTKEELQQIQKIQEEEKSKPELELPKSKEELQAEEIENLKNELIECKQSIVELTALASTVAVPKVK